MNDFAAIADRLRSTRGLSQRALAKRTGFASSTLSRWFSGESTPSVTDAARLADALGVTLDELTGRAERPSPDPDREYLDSLIERVGVRESIRRILAADRDAGNPNPSAGPTNAGVGWRPIATIDETALDDLPAPDAGRIPGARPGPPRKKGR